MDRPSLNADGTDTGEARKFGWQPHVVRRLNGRERSVELPARFQVVNDHWRKVTPRMPNIGYMPNLVYMPEKDRLLLSLDCAHPRPHTVLSVSDDHGAAWSERRWMHADSDGSPDGRGVGLTYLGGGRLLMTSEDTCSRWSSSDYGDTWTAGETCPPASDGRPLYAWDPIFVDTDPAGNVIRLVETRWQPTGVPWGSTEGAYSQALISFSADLGRSWSLPAKVPQWLGVNEINMTRARNGDLVAACRTDSPGKYAALKFDHYSGLGASISHDDGRTWSELHMLYDWGRHNAGLVVLPEGTLVMSYVVRLGYTDTPDGFHRFGIEAVVSHDHGKTWDLDHRYLLSVWKGIIKNDLEHNVAQSTSSVLLPAGNLLTAFGTGFRNSDPNVYNMEIGLVKWRVSGRPTSADRTVADAPFDSDLRNVFDPPI
jgi:hypothetical protein